MSVTTWRTGRPLKKCSLNLKRKQTNPSWLALKCRQPIRWISWKKNKFDSGGFNLAVPGKCRLLGKQHFCFFFCRKRVNWADYPSRRILFSGYSGRRRSRLFTGNVWRRRTKGRGERDTTNEGETRNEKKTPHLCPEYQLHTGGMKMLPLGSSKSPQREKF